MRVAGWGAAVGLGLALLAVPGAAALPCNPFCIDVSLDGNCSGDIAVCTGNSEASMLAVGGRNAESGIAAAALPGTRVDALDLQTKGGNAEGGLLAVSSCGNADGPIAIAPLGNADGLLEADSGASRPGNGHGHAYGFWKRMSREAC